MVARLPGGVGAAVQSEAMDKYEDATRIEAGLSLPAEVVEPTLSYIAAQDAERGDWFLCPADSNAR